MVRSRSRKIRNPRYAPESLERKLSPTDLPIATVAAAVYATPDPTYPMPGDDAADGYGDPGSDGSSADDPAVDDPAVDDPAMDDPAMAPDVPEPPDADGGNPPGVPLPPSPIGPAGPAY